MILKGDRGLLCSDCDGAVSKHGRKVAPWTDTRARRGPKERSSSWVPDRWGWKDFRRFRKVTAASEPDKVYAPANSTDSTGSSHRQGPRLEEARGIYDQVCPSPVGAHSPAGRREADAITVVPFKINTKKAGQHFMALKKIKTCIY